MILTLLQMPFLGTDGDTHADAVWYPAAINGDLLPAEFGAGIPWYVYHTPQAFGLSKTPDGQHQTQLGRAAFLGACALPAQAGETLIAHLTRAMVGGALSTRDTDTGTKDGGGLPVMASYFAQANVVALDTDTGAVTVINTPAQRQSGAPVGA